MSTSSYGQWAWVHDCDLEPNLAAKVAGLHADGSVALPPQFAERLQAVGLLDRVNFRYGTTLDFYEEEDVQSPEVMCFLAGALDECFRGHAIQGAVEALVELLLRSARLGKCLTFRL